MKWAVYLISLISAIFWFGWTEGFWLAKIAGLGAMMITMLLLSEYSTIYAWLISLSPIWWAVGATSFKESCLILLIVLEYKIIKANIWLKILIALFSMAFYVLVFNNGRTNLNKLSFINSAKEVNQRFEEEFFLENRINFPKVEEKLAYNRYFFSIKNFGKETAKLFDFDFIFFQENNQQFQHSIVIFYWWEIWLMMIGIFNYSRIKKKGCFVWWTIAAIIFFWIIDGYWYQRQILVILPIAILITKGWQLLAKQKWLLIILICLSIYSWVINYIDLNSNRPYWQKGLESKYEQNK